MSVSVLPEHFNDKTPEKFYEQGICELTGTANKRGRRSYSLEWRYSSLRKRRPNRKFNIIFSTLAEHQPRDQHEARLCVQAASLYSQGMSYLSRSESANNIQTCEFYAKNAMKFLRLHNETIEALNRYRKGNEQKIIVQHVNIDNGSQAILNNGNMDAVGGGEK